MKNKVVSVIVRLLLSLILIVIIFKNSHWSVGIFCTLVTLKIELEGLLKTEL